MESLSAVSPYQARCITFNSDVRGQSDNFRIAEKSAFGIGERSFEDCNLSKWMKACRYSNYSLAIFAHTYFPLLIKFTLEVYKKEMAILTITLVILLIDHSTGYAPVVTWGGRN